MTRARPEATLQALAALARDVGAEVSPRLEKLGEDASARAALAALARVGLTERSCGLVMARRAK
jgi:hypothetical protein